MYVYMYVPTCVAMKLIYYTPGSKMSKQETLTACRLQEGLNFTPIIFSNLKIKRISIKEHKYREKCKFVCGKSI